MSMEITDPRRFLHALSEMGICSYVSGKSEQANLTKLCRMVEGCTKCGLAKTRKSVVFGEGSDHARLLFVGEAPGEEEDLQGRPFVGRAGKLLDQMIASIGLNRADVYICNVLKCRPPRNRDPETPEVEACRPYLSAQIEAIKPTIICTLGKHAYNTLLGVDERITRIRGKLTTYHGISLLPTYHPSFLLRNPDAMKDAHEDMGRLKSLLSEAT
jgi:uracil-DNA glycosylase